MTVLNQNSKKEIRQVQPQIRQQNMNSILNNNVSLTSNNNYNSNSLQTNDTSYTSNNNDFSDDEPIIIDINKVSNETGTTDTPKDGETPNKHDLKDYIDLELKLKQRILNINSKSAEIIPMLVSLISKDMSGSEKTSIDLVCVIDKSGSMQGRKIELLRQTFDTLMELLSPSDRLSIVTFDNSSSRITPLLTMTPQNKKITLDKIRQVGASGGTSIYNGMTTALEILKQRKQVNNVSGVFLLSDGLDGSADLGVKNLVAKYDKFQNCNNISINTFGFGDDHDPKLMGNISDLKDGNFYYIDKLDTVDEAFGDCLIGLMSVLAEDVQFEIQAVKSDIFPNIKIQKAFGLEGAWKNDKEVYKIGQKHLIAGKNRNHLLELSIPAFNGDFKGEFKVVIAKAVITMCGLKETGFQILKMEKDLTVTFVGEDDKVSDDYVDYDVMFHYYRLRSVDVIAKARNLAEVGENKQAEKELQVFCDELSKSKFASHESFIGMINDIKQTIGYVQPQVYSNVGSKKMRENMQCNFKEQSNINNYCLNMNSRQMNYREDMMMKKSKK